MKKLVTIEKQVTLDLPNGSKAITNDGEWFTVARKNALGTISIITTPSDNVINIDFHEEGKWTEFYREELVKILKEIKE